MINFKTENESKMKFIDFGAFQKIEKMLSHDKILFYMLVGAFHDTPCTLCHGGTVAGICSRRGPE